eukprot:TRINITY_DN19923_c5_g1_i1.p1 TRINITY_DN19923_c5_g1~~TRINITY_DN19923_c5_g1_i1.p1  ORF type:complete len:486 (+),score=113.12 TRINITY_DN19923_c5_g1_i1:40-1497(+)
MATSAVNGSFVDSGYLSDSLSSDFEEVDKVKPSSERTEPVFVFGQTQDSAPHAAAQQPGLSTRVKRGRGIKNRGNLGTKNAAPTYVFDPHRPPEGTAPTAAVPPQPSIFGTTPFPAMPTPAPAAGPSFFQFGNSFTGSSQSSSSTSPPEASTAGIFGVNTAQKHHTPADTPFFKFGGPSWTQATEAQAQEHQTPVDNPQVFNFGGPSATEAQDPVPPKPGKKPWSQRKGQIKGRSNQAPAPAPAPASSAPAFGPAVSKAFGPNLSDPVEGERVQGNAWRNLQSKAVQAAILEAERLETEQNLSRALEAVLPVLEAPEDITNLFKRLVKGLDAEHRKLVSSHESEKNQLMVKLMDARQRVDQVKEKLQAKDLAYQQELRCRRQAEQEASRCRSTMHRHDQVMQENARLRQQLSMQKVPRQPTREQVICQLAKFECAVLLECCSEEREKMKKKLLLKWHPDKQPSADHTELATQVMQELQNRSEWTW